MILAIDQSTSATKALLFDTSGRLVDKTSLDHKQHYPQPGWVEHDAEEIWQNTLSVIKTIIGRNAKASAALLCLSITNQRETIVVFDRATGEPLHRAIVWQCRRGDPICAQLEQDGFGEKVHGKTGLKIDTYFPASKLKWMAQNCPEIKGGLQSGTALVGTVDTYLIYRLTRGNIFATDHTNASRTLLYDIGRLQWDDELCSMFDVPIHALPEVRESSANYGGTDLGGILDRPIPICGVMGDSQAALFAQRCFDEGMAKVTIGTGSSLLLNIGDELRLSEAGAVSTIAWVYDGKPTYSFEGIISYSAATIAWLVNQLELIDDPTETEALANSVDDNGGVYLVPAFAGLSAPYWSRSARAAIVGMTAHSTKGHVVRAALESIAYQIRDVLDMMKVGAGVTLRRIHADGGAAQNRFLMQFIADIVDLHVHVSEHPEFSALGATLAGTLGMGVYGSFDDLTGLPRESKIYSPQLDEEHRRTLYDGWKQAVQRVL